MCAKSFSQRIQNGFAIRGKASENKDGFLRNSINDLTNFCSSNVGGITHLFPESEGTLKVVQRLLQLPLRAVDKANNFQGGSNVGGITNLLKESEGTLKVVQRLLQLPLRVVDSTNVVQGGSNVGGITHLFPESEGTLKVVQRLLQPSQVPVDFPDMSEQIGKSSATSDLLKEEWHSLLKILQGFLQLSLELVDLPNISESGGNSRGITCLLSKDPRAFIDTQCILVLSLA